MQIEHSLVRKYLYCPISLFHIQIPYACRLETSACGLDIGAFGIEHSACGINNRACGIQNSAMALLDTYHLELWCSCQTKRAGCPKQTSTPHRVLGQRPQPSRKTITKLAKTMPNWLNCIWWIWHCMCSFVIVFRLRRGLFNQIPIRYVWFFLTPRHFRLAGASQIYIGPYIVSFGLGMVRPATAPYRIAESKTVLLLCLTPTT